MDTPSRRAASFYGRKRQAENVSNRGQSRVAAALPSHTSRQTYDRGMSLESIGKCFF